MQTWLAEQRGILPANNVVPDMNSITILLHLYYPGSWAIINEKCEAALRMASKIIITVCHNDVIGEPGYPEKTTILKVTNKGKDIGGKLVAMNYYTQFCSKTSYIVFLHDKISPQTINAGYWLEKLYSIFDKDIFLKAIHILNGQNTTGVIGAKAFLKNEYIKSRKIFASTNDGILRRLIAEYGLSCKTFNFIAGTIFIAKSRIFEDFFSRHSALAAREKLETGNVLDLEEGTYTHSWERLLCFIAQDQGYKVSGI